MAKLVIGKLVKHDVHELSANVIGSGKKMLIISMVQQTFAVSEFPILAILGNAMLKYTGNSI